MVALKDNKLTTKKYGVVYCEEYVKEKVLDYLFILNCWNDIDSSVKIDEEKLFNICKKYELDYTILTIQDYCHQELVEKIFGDWENENGNNL